MMTLFLSMIWWPLFYLHYQTPAEPPPWEKAPFETPPQQLIEAAAAFAPPEGEDVDTFLSQTTYVMEDDGTLRFEGYFVYRLLTEEAVDSWSDVDEDWLPWYQNRPEIRIRITNPDGTSRELDPATLQESSDSGEERIYRDLHRLRAPLPSVTKGSIIEERVRTTEHRPFFAEGTIYSWYTVAGTRQRVRRLILDFPVELPPKTLVRLGENLEPRTEERDGRWRTVYELRDTEPYEPAVSNLPFHQTQWPYVTFSTGTSWNKVARTYAEWVEGRLADEDFSWVPRDLAVKGDTRATAFNFMDWLNRRIRYTGMELGESSLVPAKPSVCLERGFGDCKDKATMLVGMLQEVGIKAHVALLSAGLGKDSDPELPGMGNFNHAIVFVPNGSIWLDPTEELINENLLPITDQDRWALIAAKKTKALVKTPAFPSSANWVREKRAYRLPDSGLGTATVELVHGGGLASEYRSMYSGSTSEDLKESWGDYVSRTFRGAKIDSFDLSDPRDLTVPLKINMGLTDLGRGLTDDNNAVAAVMLYDVFDYLPAEFKQEGEPRKYPYLFYTPHTYRIEFDIQPPDGFTLTSMPESGERAVGTGKVTYAFEEMENHRIRAMAELDTGKRLLSPEEFETYRKDAMEVMDQTGLIVSFHHEGEKLLSEGKYREALASFKQLAQTHPNQEIHQIRLARAFLTVGLVAEAREAAEQAVALNPESVDVHNTLGWVLQHDDLGRHMYPGFDRAGAIAAYERAIAVDPRHYESRGNFAILLEYDESGFRYNSGHDLDRAIDNYRYIRNELDNENLDNNLCLDLAHRGRFQELVDFLGKPNLQDQQKVYRVVGIAGSQGLEAGFAEVASLSTLEKRAEVFVKAGQILARLGKLDHAAAFMRQAAKGSANAMALDTLADLYERAGRRRLDELNPDDPIDMFMAFTLSLVTGSEDFADLKKLLHPDLFDALTEEGGLLQGEIDIARSAYLETGLPPEITLRIGLAGMETVTDGEPDIGYRVRYNQEGDGSFILVAPTAEGLRLVGFDEVTWGAGVQALKFLQQGRLEACATWLGWMLPAEIKANAKKLPPMNTVWKEGDALDPQRMELAAMLLLTEERKTSEANLPRLEALRAEATDPAVQDVADLHLAEIYQRMDAFDKAEPIIDRLFEKYPEDPEIFLRKQKSLLRNNRLEEAERLALGQLGLEDSRTAAVSALSDIYTLQNNWEALKKVVLNLDAKGKCGQSEYNLYAWRALFADAVDDQILELCRRAVQLSGGESYAILHTLAAAYADVGRCKEARELLFSAMKKDGRIKPGAPDWLVLGRIAEKYGEWKAARRAYAKVEKPEDESEIPSSSYALAQQWLAAMPEEGGQADEADAGNEGTMAPVDQ